MSNRQCLTAVSDIYRDSIEFGHGGSKHERAPCFFSPFYTPEHPPIRVPSPARATETGASRTDGTGSIAGRANPALGTGAAEPADPTAAVD